ncbi:MAG TPA: type II CAAX endopeptidase family protein [bacterium]|nr:type II CAAX endopeptidase family protein [bacterium]
MSVLTNADGTLRAWLRLAIFYVAALGGALALMVGTAAAFALAGVRPHHPGFDVAGMNPWFLAAAGLVAVLPLTAATAGARRFLDRKAPLASLGLAPKGAMAALPLGFAGGVIFLSLTCLAIALAGGAEFRLALSSPTAIFTLAGPFAFFAVFAGAEELLLRGYPIKVLDESWNRPAAVLVTAAAFGLLHLLNPGAGLLPTVNVTLAGVILGLLYLQSGSLWLAIGFHWGWNFAEGGLFGFAVSGYRFPGRLAEASARGPAWLSGADFGPEGSVVLTAACAVLIALALTRRIPYPKTPTGATAGGDSR